MKSINARATLVFSLFWLIPLAMVTLGYAGDYYTYRDSSGKLVISNYAPPEGSDVIKKETLSEVTDQQILESQLRENRLAFDNRLSSLERSVGALTENLRAENEVINNPPLEGYGDANIAVGVTQAPIIVAKPPHKKFNHPANPRRNFPNLQPRPVAPAARGGGSGRAGKALFVSYSFISLPDTDQSYSQVLVEKDFRWTSDTRIAGKPTSKVRPSK